MTGKISATIIALGTLFFAAGCNGPTTANGVGITPTGTSDPMSTAGATVPKPVNAKLSAEELCKQYVANEATADETYKGKFVEITGDVVMPVQSGFSADHFLIISGAGEKSPGGRPFIRCFISNDDLKEANGLTAGKNVTLRGFCEGRSVNFNETLLDLKRCTISKAEQ